MRNNQPIVDKEYLLSDQIFIVSRTDISGTIVSCNQDFIEASGYSENELIGQPHNLLRHPDMPVEAFADFWACLKQGQSWHGIVKNRRKDGLYYWVHADVSQVLENGKCVGYVSVRTKPSRSDVEVAGVLYRKFREGKQGDLVLQSGRAAKRRQWWHKLIPERIATKLWLAFGVMLAAMLFDASQGYFALKQADEAFADVAKRRLNLAVNIHKIGEHASNVRGQITFALQHDPNGRISLLHDHPTSKHLELIDNNLDAMQKEMDEFVKDIRSENGKKIFAELKSAVDQYRIEAVLPTKAALAAGHFDEAANLSIKKVIPLRDAVMDKVEAYADHEMTDIYQASNSISDNARHSNHLLLISMFASVCIMLLYSLRLVHNITQSAYQVRNLMVKSATEGDLSLRSANINPRDEMGQISSAFNELMINFSANIDDVKKGSAEMQKAAQSLTQSANEVNQGSIAQNESAFSTAAGVEEVAVSISVVAENATLVGQQASESAKLTREGNRNVDAIVTEITNIEQVMQQVDNSANHFIDRARTIAGMTQQVKDIAEQTNLLALNAAIEAARAGEQGRGFAVVADEVRKLAEKSARSASEIDTITRELDAQSGQVEKAIEQGVRSIHLTQTNIQQVSTLLLEAGNAVDQTTAGMTEIANAVTEQKAATESIAQNIEGIAQLAERNHLAVGNTRESIIKLEALSHRLKLNAERFKI